MSSQQEGTILVLGCRGSGASAVARRIASHGFPVRCSSPEGNDDGDRGADPLGCFNDRILDAVGVDWSHPAGLDESSFLGRDLEEIREAARGELLRISGAGTTWVWEDPRNSLALPFWAGLLPARRAAVFVVRPPHEVIPVLAGRYGISEPLGLALWERTSREALRHLTGWPVLVLEASAHVDGRGPALSGVEPFLRAAGFESVTPRRDDARFGPADPVPSPTGWEETHGLSPEQRALARTLAALRGPHPTFEASLPGRETAWVTALLSERSGRFRAERRLRDRRLRVGSESAPVPGLERELERARRDRRRLERTVNWLLARANGANGIPVEDPPEDRTAVGGEHVRYGPDAERDEAGYLRWLEALPPGASVGPSVPEDAPARLRIVMPGRPEGDALAASLGSLRAQRDPRWRLCAHDLDAPPSGDHDPRICFGDRCADAGAVALLEPGDELGREAVAAVGRLLDEQPDVDVVYSDEDSLDAAGGRSAPFFKPDWSPDHLLADNYVGGLLVVRSELFDAIGGLRSRFASAAGHDLALRAGERARRVWHLDEVLYHRRASRRPRESERNLSRAAIEEALARRGEDAEVVDGLIPGTWRVRRRVVGGPRVRIVVPFRDEPWLLRKCVESLEATSGYGRWTVSLVDNGSRLPETATLLDSLRRHARVRVVRDDTPFNWAALNNRVVAESDEELLLFLNNDVEARSNGWLLALVEQAACPEVGAVGARLVYPDGRVQHAGITLGTSPVARHGLRHCPPDDPGYHGFARVVRNLSAVTGACLMTRRETFEAAGGFDESLPVAYNDVDFCLRLRSMGYRIVYTPFAELIHHESRTRGASSDREEIEEMRRRWGAALERDPYYPRQLSRLREDFGMPTKEETAP